MQKKFGIAFWLGMFLLAGTLIVVEFPMLVHGLPVWFA